MALIGGFDLETTGLSFADGDKIIEIALLVYDDETEKLVSKYVQRINPRRNISPAAMEVHGITYDMVEMCPSFDEVAEEVFEHLESVPRLVIHNAKFDGPFIAGELRQCGRPQPSCVSYCTAENGRWATFDGKTPNLGELCFATGVDYDPSKAHAAEYDVDRMMHAYFNGRRRGFFM